MAEEKYLKANSVRLRYLDWGGSGAPLLLLHGGMQTADCWESFAALARPRFRPIAPDLRGHGSSDADPEGRYRLALFIKDIELFIDLLKLKRLAIIGFSLGGLVAINYAAERSEELCGLVIVDIGPKLERDGLKRMRERIMAMPAVFDSLEQAVEYMASLNPRRSREKLYARLSCHLRREQDGKYIWKVDRRFIESWARAGADFSYLWGKLPAIKCPALIVRGAESDLLSRKTCQDMLAAMPQAEFVEISAAGHSVADDNPEAFASEVLSFLERRCAF